MTEWTRGVATTGEVDDRTRAPSWSVPPPTPHFHDRHNLHPLNWKTTSRRFSLKRRLPRTSAENSRRRRLDDDDLRPNESHSVSEEGRLGQDVRKAFKTHLLHRRAPCPRPPMSLRRVCWMDRAELRPKMVVCYTTATSRQVIRLMEP